MPTQETVTETYWSWCKKKVWGITVKYPCRKTRTVTNWCYQFKTVKVYHYVFWCIYEGCEAGKLYKWSGGCLGIGTSTVYNINKCFSSPLDEIGTC
jgi:hypothetical protein